MPSTGFNEYHDLTPLSISRNVAAGKIGVYVLGTLNLAGRLAKWVGKCQQTHFKFGYFTTAQTAYQKECQVWHDFGGPEGKLENEIHPDRPSGSSAVCPVCPRVPGLLGLGFGRR